MNEVNCTAYLVTESVEAGGARSEYASLFEPTSLDMQLLEIISKAIIYT